MAADASCISVSLFGDVMTARGIDQILPYPGDPRLHEDYVKDARRYVQLAEEANGPLPYPVGFDYIWGDLPAELKRLDGGLIVANLETAVTSSEAHWPGKGIHYRMHPRNVQCLKVVGDACWGLANNHVLDWGFDGLEETLRTLDGAHLARVGAGRTKGEAEGGVACRPGGGEGGVIVVAAGTASSGIPATWAATATRVGVNLLPDLSRGSAQQLAAEVHRLRQPGDVAVASLHWGGNWGYDVPAGQIEFAHALIDEGLDVVHGHSSHHVKGIEVYRSRLIVYGAGDLVNDYEGIGGHESYRPDVRMAVIARLARNGSGLQDVQIIPLVARRMRLATADDAATRWLAELLTREGSRFDTRAEWNATAGLHLRWS